MFFKILDQSLPGYEGHGTIQIIYEIQERTQGLDLPNPDANSACTAYLPYTQEGCEVFQVHSGDVLTLGVHAHKGYSTHSVCVHVCVYIVCCLHFMFIAT